MDEDDRSRDGGLGIEITPVGLEAILPRVWLGRAGYGVVERVDDLSVCTFEDARLLTGADRVHHFVEAFLLVGRAAGWHLVGQSHLARFWKVLDRGNKFIWLETVQFS